MYDVISLREALLHSIEACHKRPFVVLECLKRSHLILFGGVAIWLNLKVCVEIEIS